jgi:hypothetical protein
MIRRRLMPQQKILLQKYKKERVSFAPDGGGKFIV